MLGRHLVTHTGKVVIRCPWGEISPNPGWWLTYPSEKYDIVKWDDDIPNMMGKSWKIPWFQSPPIRVLTINIPLLTTIHQTTNQTPRFKELPASHSLPRASVAWPRLKTALNPGHQRSVLRDDLTFWKNRAHWSLCHTPNISKLYPILSNQMANQKEEGGIPRFSANNTLFRPPANVLSTGQV